MFSILLSVLISSIFASLASLWLASIAWIITIVIVTFFLVFALINRLLGKKLMAVANGAQIFLQQSQQDTQRLVGQFQNRPGGSKKQMERQVEKAIEVSVRQALEMLENAKPLYKWSILAERQINTMKVQLLFQIKHFEEVDPLLPKVFILDPLTLAMKMVREYHKDSPDLEKTFQKGLRKFKGEKAVLIYSLYAWILIQKKELDKALTILAKAKEKIDNPVINKNWQHVANNKPHLYSNAGLGEQWYALHLEKPKQPKADRKHLRNHPMAQKGRRRNFR